MKFKVYALIILKQIGHCTKKRFKQKFISDKEYKIFDSDFLQSLRNQFICSKINKKPYCSFMN